MSSRGRPFVCFNELKVGRLSYSGLLAQLDEGVSPDGGTHWLTWTNSEIRQCFGKGASDIHERDFCQVAEGVPVGKRIQDELVEKVAHFHFIIGAQEKALHEVFGGVENGRYRGFSVPIEKANVMDISMAKKLAAQSESMAVLKDTQKFVVQIQHVGTMQVPCVRHSPATFAVVNAMHEAVREVVSALDDGDSSEQSAIANAIWPALIKLVGKALCSLAVSNLFCRNGVWATDGDHAWVDDTTRIGDALAAALGVLVNMASQAWCEAFIVSAGHGKVIGGRVASGDGTVASTGRPQKLTNDELGDVDVLGLRVLAALAWRDNGKQLLQQGGVKEQFDEKKHHGLRYARDLIGASAVAWRKGVSALAAKQVLVRHDAASWKLGGSDVAVAYLRQHSFDFLVGV